MSAESDNVLQRNSKRKFELIVQPRARIRPYLYDMYAQITRNRKGIRFAEGGGISTSKSKAKKRAIGEAIERYCGSVIPRKLLFESFNTIASYALDPLCVIPFKKSQYISGFPYVPYTRSMKIEWTKGYSLFTKNPVYLPAFRVYLGYNSTGRDKKKFMPTTSCGLAEDHSIEKAIIHAIFELIERDAAILGWYAQKAIPRLDLSTVQLSSLRELCEHIYKEGLIPEVSITTLDLPIPSVIGIVYSKHKDVPYASFGLGAGKAIEEVALKALEEALMIRNTLEHVSLPISSLRKEQVIDFLSHAIFYAFPSTKKYWRFLLQGPLLSSADLRALYNFPNFISGDWAFKQVIKQFEQQKQEIFWKEVTTKLVRDVGYRVVRVLIPDLHPMDINYTARFLGGKRLKTFLGRGNINQAPHPFA